MNVPRTPVNPALKMVQELAGLRKEMQAIGFRIVLLREVAIGALMLLHQSHRLTPEIKVRLEVQIDTFQSVLARCMGMPPEVYNKISSTIDPKQREKEVVALSDKLRPVIITPPISMPGRRGEKLIIP